MVNGETVFTCDIRQLEFGEFGYTSLLFCPFPTGSTLKKFCKFGDVTQMMSLRQDVGLGFILIQQYGGRKSVSIRTKLISEYKCAILRSS